MSDFRSRTVFVYGAQELLKEIAKKGTESDIALYNRKEGEEVTTFLSPLRYPDKISSLTDSIFPSGYAVIDGRKTDKFLGEVMVSLDLFRKREGTILVDDYTDTSVLKKIIAGTSIEDYGFFNGSGMELMHMLEDARPAAADEKTSVIIDHAFTVKSVGAVALGFVLSGEVRRHQGLKAAYAGKEIQVKSIQMHDEDQESAGKGSRVGLSLKNIVSESIERGEIFGETVSAPIKKSELEIEVHRAVKNPPSGSSEVFLADFMRFQRGRLENATIEMDREFHPIGEWMVLGRQNEFPRVFSRCRIISG